MSHSVAAGWWRREPARASVELGASTSAAPQDGAVVFWCLIAYTVALLLEPHRYLPVLDVIHFNRLLAIVAIGAYIFGSRPAPEKRVSTESVLAVGLVFCGALSIPGSYWPGASFDWLIDFTKVLAIAWLIGQAFSSVQRLRILLWVFAISTIPIALTAIQDYFAGALIRGRIVGFGRNLAANPNDLALLLNLFLPLTAFLAFTTRRITVRLLALAIIAVSIGAVMVTLSRGGFVTLAVEAVLLALLLARRGFRSAIGALFLCGLLALTFMPAGYGDRIATVMDVNSDPTGSSQARWHDTVVAVNLMLSKPFLGSGIGQGVLALNEAGGTGWTVVHNAYLNYGVDLGVPGFLVFLGLVWVSFRTIRRTELNKAVAPDLSLMAGCLRVSLVGFIVAALFHPIGYDFYFFYLAGIGLALQTTAVRQFGVREAS